MTIAAWRFNVRFVIDNSRGRLIESISAVPLGLRCSLAAVPALKRRAILDHPCGMMISKF